MIVSFVGLVFFVIGVGVLISGIFSVFKVRRQIAGSVETVGTVIGFGRQNGQRGYIYCPQVSFADADGRNYQFQSEVGTQPPSYKIGQTVEVIYKKDAPHRAEIDSLTALWFAPGCMLAMGLGFSVLGIILFFVGIIVHLKT